MKFNILNHVRDAVRQTQTRSPRKVLELHLSPLGYDELRRELGFDRPDITVTHVLGFPIVVSLLLDGSEIEVITES